MISPIRRGGRRWRRTAWRSRPGPGWGARQSERVHNVPTAPALTAPGRLTTAAVPNVPAVRSAAAVGTLIPSHGVNVPTRDRPTARGTLCVHATPLGGRLPQPRGQRRSQGTGLQSPPPTPAGRGGSFIRAELPRPSTSCAWIIATRAGERIASRIRLHHGSRSATPKRANVSSTAARTGSESPEYQPEPCRGRACRCTRPGSRHGSRTGADCPDRSGSKPNWSTSIPGSPSESRRRSTGGVIAPRSSATSGNAPSSRATASNTARPGPRFQRPPSRRPGAGVHRPVGDEASEVVDPREVEQRRTCAAAARPTSDSAAGAAPASRRAGSPTADPLPRRHPAARRRPARPERARDERDGRRSRARRRSQRRRTGARRARPRTGATPPTRGRSAPGRPPRRGPPTAPSPRSRTRCAHGNHAARTTIRAPGDRPEIAARRRRRSGTCTASGGDRAARAAAAATTSDRPRPASRRTRRRPAPAVPREAT